MPIASVRKSRLILLLAEDTGPKRGQRARLAKRLKVAPAQISQWLNDDRTIDEKSARQIEQNAGKPARWLDEEELPNKTVTLLGSATPEVSEVVEQLGALLHQVSHDNRPELVNAMSAFVLSGGQGHYLHALVGLLTPALAESRKRTSSAG